jgi:hypothetical protein
MLAVCLYLVGVIRLAQNCGRSKRSIWSHLPNPEIQVRVGRVPLNDKGSASWHVEDVVVVCRIGEDILRERNGRGKPYAEHALERQGFHLMMMISNK